MSKMPWRKTIASLSTLLGSAEFNRFDGQCLDQDDGFAALARAAQLSGTIFLIGNGASASMASHVAADLANNANLRTRVFSDFPLMSAVSNDLGYEKLFAELLQRDAGPTDMLVAISSSGRSANILAAAKTAREIGASIFTLTAMDAENPLRKLGDWNVYAPATTYGDAETCHAAILHHWINALAD